MAVDKADALHHPDTGEETGQGLEEKLRGKGREYSTGFWKGRNGLERRR
jgi:hypothetical protein